MTPNRMTTVINTTDIKSTMSKASNMNLKAIMALNKNIARLCEFGRMERDLLMICQ